MKLVILAGGFAARFETMAQAVPKHLLPVSKGVFLDLLIKTLKNTIGKFDDIVIISNDINFQKTQKWAELQGFRITVVNDRVRLKKDKLGAIGDLLLAINYFDHPSDVLICPNDYVLEGFDFESFIRFFKSKNASVTITKFEKNEDILSSGSCLKLASDNRVTQFIEKPKKIISNNYGIPYYIIKEDDLPRIKGISLQNRENLGEIAVSLVESSELYAFKYRGKSIHLTLQEDYKRLLKECRNDFK